MADELIHEELEELFSKAAERMRANTSLRLSNEQKLDIYAHYKQSTEGKCHTPRPSFFDFTGRAKWDAWNKLESMDKATAMKQYIKIVNTVDPEWETSSLPADTPKSSNGGGGSGRVVSTLAETTETIPEDQKNLFDFCREGNLEKMLECIKNGEDINQHDDQGMAPIHWVCDRGSNPDMLQSVIDNGACVNVTDSEGQTPLHYAAVCGHPDIIRVLLNNGADKIKTDDSGTTPVDVCDPTVAHLLN